jgi:hypothetical protein
MIALWSSPTLGDGDPDMPFWGNEGMTVSLRWDPANAADPSLPYIAITPYYFAENVSRIVEPRNEMKYLENEKCWGFDAKDGEQKLGYLDVRVSNTSVEGDTKYITVQYEFYKEGHVSWGEGVGTPGDKTTRWQESDKNKDLGGGWTQRTTYFKVKPQPKEERVRIGFHISGPGKVRVRNVNVTTTCIEWEPLGSEQTSHYHCYGFGDDTWPPEASFEGTPNWHQGTSWDRYGSHEPIWMPRTSVNHEAVGVWGLPGGFAASSVIALRTDDLQETAGIKHVACQFDFYAAQGGVVLCESQTAPGSVIENYREEFQDVGEGWQRCLVRFDAVPPPDWEEFRWVMLTEPGGGFVALDNVAVSATTLSPDEWHAGFEIYDPGTGLHGQHGWKGWDNNPDFDALVSQDQAHEGLQSVDVADNTDIVQQLGGITAGKYICTAWQYIPSDFQSGGSGQFAGSYLVMLNTYADGGPHEESDWSVQMQFDSDDGMLKVYHGDGLNTINVPYATDRWVEIRAAIDLDHDWTKIYYDGALVTEYPWTAGVLGGGGGALNIAALDLFAGHSTSIYYDDIWLRPQPLPGDLNCDGVVGFGDINPFVLVLTNLHEYMERYPECVLNADINGDGQVNFRDINPFVALLTGW